MKMYETAFYNYAAGVEYSLRWTDERRYRQAIKFLNQLTGGSLRESNFDSKITSYFVLHNKEQVDAVAEFHKRNNVDSD